MGFSMYSKGKVHPFSGSPQTQPLPKFLPQTIISLSVSMPSEDQEILFYLIAYSLNVFSSGFQNLNQKDQGKGRRRSSSVQYIPHEVCFECSCFECYMGFWGRWNGSQNRDLIHKGMEIFEESMERGGLGGKSVSNGKKMKAKEEKKLQAKELVSWLESNTDLIGGGGKERRGILLVPKNEEEEKKDSGHISNNNKIGFGDGDDSIRMTESRNPTFMRRMLPDFMGFLTRLS